MTTTSDVLNRAADLIQERGWSKGSGWFPEAGESTPVCAEGALRLAVGGDGLKKNAVTAVLGHYLADLHPDIQRSSVHGGAIVFAWNDVQADATPVIEALRACAVIESAREHQASRERMPEAMRS